MNIVLFHIHNRNIFAWFAVSVDYKDEDSIPIVYKRFLQNIGTNGLRVQLNGKQSSENCFYNSE